MAGVTGSSPSEASQIRQLEDVLGSRTWVRNYYIKEEDRAVDDGSAMIIVEKRANGFWVRWVEPDHDYPVSDDGQFLGSTFEEALKAALDLEQEGG